jgi:hypothetical protein
MYRLSFMWQVLASPLPKAVDPLGRTNERAFPKFKVHSAEESEAEVEEEEEESDDEFCDRTTAPVPKWEVLAGIRAVWVQLCQQLRLGQGSLG